MKKWISLICKLIVVLSSFIGLTLVLCNIDIVYVGGIKGLMYFTNLSNFWIGIVCLCALIMLFKGVEIKPWMYIIKLVFTVSITLTGVVYCLLLAPFMPEDPWCSSSILTHIVVPLFAVVDFLVYDLEFDFKYKHSLFVLIPPIYYLGYSLIGFLLNWDFGLGENYPYFFLDWGAPVGIFGISAELPHYLGTFYWLIILLIIVFGMGILYIIGSKVYNKIGKNR